MDRIKPCGRLLRFHLSLYREGHWGTTDDIKIYYFSVLRFLPGFDELRVCPFLDVVFPPLRLSALSSSISLFHPASQDGFGYTRRTGNMSVPSQFVSLYDGQEPLLATVKKRKLAWFGHVTRHDSRSQTILRGTLEGGRRRGRQRKCWLDNIKEWTDVPGHARPVHQGPLQKRLEEGGCRIVPHVPTTTQSVKGLN